MEKPTEERRRASYAGLLDSAMRAAVKLSSLPDPVARALANQILTDLKQIRRLLPVRRKFDTEAPRKDA
jgi:hypothetical protein